MKIEKYFDKKLQKTRWRFDVTVAGVRYRESGLRTRAICEEMIDELRLDARLIKRGLKTKPLTVTLEQLAEARLADPTTGQLPAVRKAVRTLFALIPPSTLVTDLDVAHLRKLVTALHERELASGTINVYLAALSAMFNHAAEYFPQFSQHHWPKIPWLPPVEGRTRVLSNAELSKIFCALLEPKQPFESQESYDHRDDVGDLIRLALLLAARENELLNLSPAAINWDWLTVKIEATKTKRSRVLPLTPSGVAILRPRSNQNRLFEGFNDDALQRWCAAIGERAGVPWGQRTENGWTFHDLRRTAATVLESSGVPYSAVAAILGHKRRDQTAVYTVAALPQLRDAAAVLENWCQQIVGFNYRFRNSIGSIGNFRNREIG